MLGSDWFLDVKKRTKSGFQEEKTRVLRREVRVRRREAWCGEEKKWWGEEEKWWGEEKKWCGDEKKWCGEEKKWSREEKKWCGDEKKWCGEEKKWCGEKKLYFGATIVVGLHVELCFNSTIECHYMDGCFLQDRCCLFSLQEPKQMLIVHSKRNATVL